MMWSASNLYKLNDQALTQIVYDAKNKGPVLDETVVIMENYSESERNDNVIEIISLYKSVVSRFHNINDIVVETIDALFEYTYSLLTLSFLNCALLLYLLISPRYNKSLNNGRS
jgi:hypothetical protein